jgi:hypothetical protein
MRWRFGAGVNDVRRHLHGVDPDDRLYVGDDCAIEIKGARRPRPRRS